MSNDNDDLQILAGWFAVKSSDFEGVAKKLNLHNLREGRLDDIFPQKHSPKSAQKDNIFVCLCNAWSILFYDTLDFDCDIDNLLVTLSTEFREAQHFWIDTEYTFSVEWKLAKDGFILRAVSFGEDFNVYGDVTDAESFIDWDRFDGDEDEEEILSLGSSEVLRVARQWSVDPIIENPHPQTGVIGML